MKKSLSLLIVLISTTLSSVRAQTGFAPEIGFHVSNMAIVPPGSFSVSNTALAGGRIGGALDMNLSENIYFQSGVFFTLKGNKRTFNYHSGDTSETVNETLKVNYIEVPATVVYKTGQQGMGRFFCGLGVAFSYAVGGSDKVDDYTSQNGQNQEAHTNTKVVAGTTVNGFDIGMNVLAGYELHTGLFFQAAYTMGIANVSTINDESDKNRIFEISAGFYFGKGRHKNLATEDIIVE